MVRAVIIDDEQHCIDRLNHLLDNYASRTVEVVGCCKTVNEGIDYIRAAHPDLLFLDIQICDVTGFELLKAFPKPTFEIIFTTAYEQYAVKAFKFSAVDYLLKPIDRDELLASLDRLKERVSQLDRAKRFDVLFDNLRMQRGMPRRITLPTVSGYSILYTADIIRCQADVNYTHLFLKDKQKMTVAKPLKEFDELLADHNFYRVHNSHLINLDYISRYVKGKGGYIVMEDQTEIEVSTRRKEAFLERLKQISNYKY